MRILIFLVATLITNVCNAEDVIYNRNKTSEEAKIIDSLGKEVDTCRDAFFINEYKNCPIDNLKDCYNRDIDANNKLKDCYLEVANKIVTQFYSENKEKSLQQIQNYAKSSFEANLNLYSSSNYCKPSCGLEVSLFASQATNYDLQEYILRMLDYLYANAP